MTKNGPSVRVSYRGVVAKDNYKWMHSTPVRFQYMNLCQSSNSVSMNKLRRSGAEVIQNTSDATASL